MVTQKGTVMIMKKIFSMLLAVMMLASNAVFAASEEGKLSVEVKLDATANSLVVSGKVKSDKSGVPLVLLIKENGNIVWGDQIETSAPQNGFSTYSFEPFVIPTNKVSTAFAVTVSADYVDETKNINYSYGGIDIKHSVLAKITQYDKSVNVDAMQTEVIEASSEIVGIDAAVYGNLSSAAKGILAKVASAGEYTCPANYESEEDIAKINEQIQMFALSCKDAEVIAKLADVDTKEELLAWTNDIVAKYDFSTDDAHTEDNEKLLYDEYFAKID